MKLYILCGLALSLGALTSLYAEYGAFPGGPGASAAAKTPSIEQALNALYYVSDVREFLKTYVMPMQSYMEGFKAGMMKNMEELNRRTDDKIRDLITRMSALEARVDDLMGRRLNR